MSKNDEVIKFAEECGLWPTHDDIREQFLDGAQMKEELVNFKNMIREKDAQTIAQQKEEIARLSQQVVDLGVIVMQSKPRKD